MFQIWVHCIKTKGYWVGRVVLGFFICKKHSDTEKTDQIAHKC